MSVPLCLEYLFTVTRIANHLLSSPFRGPSVCALTWHELIELKLTYPLPDTHTHIKKCWQLRLRADKQPRKQSINQNSFVWNNCRYIGRQETAQQPTSVGWRNSDTPSSGSYLVSSGDGTLWREFCSFGWQKKGDSANIWSTCSSYFPLIYFPYAAKMWLAWTVLIDPVPDFVYVLHNNKDLWGAIMQYSSGEPCGWFSTDSNDQWTESSPGSKKLWGTNSAQNC